MSTSETNCPLCLTNFPTDQMLDIGKCVHKICSECLVKYITNKLQAKMKCPVSDCSSSISDPTIRMSLSNNQITKYEELSIHEASSMARKCPIDNCPFVFIVREPIGIFICNYCESPICIKCNANHYPADCGNKAFNAIQIYNKAVEVITKKRRIEFKEIDAKYDLLPNQDFFKCVFCCDWILPRKGVILRNCNHCFCQLCLKETYTHKKYTHQFKCQICNVKLQDKELTVLIEEKRFYSMKIQEASLLLYHCKNPNCHGTWHMVTSVDSYQCPLCKCFICMKCNDIHDGVTCEVFRNTDTYIKANKDFEYIKKESHVSCHSCKAMLIQKGGCGALHCEKCGYHTCVFTGLFAGKHDPKKCGCWTSIKCDLKDKYCGCTTIKPCHIKCEYGCFAED